MKFLIIGPECIQFIFKPKICHAVISKGFKRVLHEQWLNKEFRCALRTGKQKIRLLI